MHDPPLSGELDRIRSLVAARMERLLAQDAPGLREALAFVGTAGTVTNLAAIDLALSPYDPDRVNGHRLTRDRVEALTERLASLPLAERRQVPGLEPGRADVIVAGGIICLGAMQGLGFADLTVSDSGLREGILVDLLSRSGARGPVPSPRREGLET
jgi:exopolyphosphatase/guanosine-5'-triphosphate,3'-diphosphate pyrophosphatase